MSTTYIQQSGLVTPLHLTAWTYTGTVQDAGPNVTLSSGVSGLVLTATNPILNYPLINGGFVSGSYTFSLPTTPGLSGQVLATDGTGKTYWSSSAGTVTSVSFTGGLISVGTATTTPALTVAGTSGGIPYFSSSSTWASSAALTASQLVIGGGAGGAPTTLAAGTNGYVLTMVSGSPAWASAPSSPLTVGTTTISSGTNGYILYDNAGVLGNLATTGSGSVVLATSPSLITPNLDTPTSITLTNGTGLPISTGVSGLGTGVATALASTPTGSGSIVLATSPTLVTPTLGVASATSYTATTTITGSSTTGAFNYGTLSFSDVGLFAEYTVSSTTYAQMVLQNTSSGTGASADYIVANNNGTATTYYGDFGINSSTFSGTSSLSLPNATYLYAANGDLALGTYTSNAIHFVVNNGATDAMTISSAGVVTLGTPLPITSGGTGITNTPYVGLEFIISGGASPITAGVKGYCEVPFACTVVAWTIILYTSAGAAVTDSITIDVLGDTYANTISSASIVGAGTKPFVSAATKNQSAPTGWTTTSLSAGEIVGFNVTAATTTATNCLISLKLQRT